MATYTKVKGIPGQERSAEITAVSAGDKINIRDVLGRPAQGVKFIMTGSTDTIEYKLNNLRHLKKPMDKHGSLVDPSSFEVEVWSGAKEFVTYSATGADEHKTEDGLSVSAIEIVSLTLSSGSTISIMVW